MPTSEPAAPLLLYFLRLGTLGFGGRSRSPAWSRTSWSSADDHAQETRRLAFPAPPPARGPARVSTGWVRGRAPALRW